MKEKNKSTDFFIQCVATIMRVILIVSVGICSILAVYHTIQLYLLLMRLMRVLSMPMTSTHISLLGSLYNLGGFLIMPFCGYVFNTLGRKYATALFGLLFVYRALVMVLIVLSVASLMGPIAVQVYAEPIFMESAPSMDDSQCAALMSLVFFVSSVLCVLAVDLFGRQLLLVSTATACGICAALLGILLQFHCAPERLLVLLIYMFCFSYTTGCSTTPYVLMAEVFVPEVRSLCNAIAMTILWILNFVALTLYSPIVDIVGLGIMFYIFATVCFFVAVDNKLYIPETKGMSVEDIQKLFNK